MVGRKDVATCSDMLNVNVGAAMVVAHLAHPILSRNELRMRNSSSVFTSVGRMQMSQ